jgi:hypothetical protein
MSITATSDATPALRNVKERELKFLKRLLGNEAVIGYSLWAKRGLISLRVETETMMGVHWAHCDRVMAEIADRSCSLWRRFKWIGKRAARE